MQNNFSRDEIISIAMEILIKGGLLLIILYYAFLILKPFLIPVIWGIIIAITFSPIITKLDKKLPLGRVKIITLATLFAISVLVVPTYMLSDSVLQSSQDVVTQIKEGTFNLPEPSVKVKEWPLIGEKTYQIWMDASINLQETLQTFKPQLQQFVPKVFHALGNALGAVAQFVISLIIAAIFLATAQTGVNTSKKIAKRLLGEKGEDMVTLSALTIKSVVQGVIGIAITQAVLSFIGMAYMDVPLAWLWAFIVLFVAIIQLPPIIVLGPVIAYVFSYADTTPATVFAVYAVVVGASDGVLKPLFLGRGVDIPMLVILLGAIGGMIVSGILGLFVGAVILALTYKLFTFWIDGGMIPDNEQTAK